MSVCFCIDNSTLSRNISNGSRNNPADVHRTSRTSLQFHHNNRHNVPHPTPKHTDKVNTAPHTTTQELKTPSAQRSASNTEAYRQKSTPHPTPQPKNSKLPRHNVPHPIPKHTDKSQHRITHHNPRTLKKKPEGCAEGPWLYGPFAVFPQLPKAKKPGPLPRKQNQNQNPITQ